MRFSFVGAGVETVDYSLLPSEEFKSGWVRHYLETKFQLQGKSKDSVTDKDVERTRILANKFSLVSFATPTYSAHFWFLRNPSQDPPLFQWSLNTPKRRQVLGCAQMRLFLRVIVEGTNATHLQHETCCCGDCFNGGQAVPPVAPDAVHSLPVVLCATAG